ncbi:hypothetical protein HID58_035249 [Brassica napus]|uniref:CBS domain-containing protein n=1 Tax=Brassica napus TaxID=3708 RepID=A0ABQ8C4Q5_BRANA|nr:hypothetical protein HID58_035249 [Brassica napus]
MSKEGLARGIGPFKPVAGRAWAEDPTSRNVAGLAGIDLRGMGSVRDGPKKTAGKNGAYTVGDFITGRQHLRVIDDDWNLVGLVSDYDLVALDSISDGEGGGW